MSQFTVYRSQFSVSSPFTVFNTHFATQTQALKTENRPLKTTTTEGVA